MQRSVFAVVRATGLRRRHLAAARMRGEREFLSRFAERSRAIRPRILCYHGVGTASWGVNDVSPERFREQLELALSDGYRFIDAHEAARQRTPRTLAVTFDDGLATVATAAAPILRELAIPFTVFVVTDWADGKHAFGDDTVMSWRQLERLVAAGATIGSHSASHANFKRLSRAEASFELNSSRDVIAARLGLRPTAFAIPFGRSFDWTAEASTLATAAGYTTIFAQSENACPRGTIPRTFVARWDHSTVFRAALEGALDDWEEWT
jgi:peptidoglycan/xylan/chitin deacetylase (PgdA/CDA1 family)